MPNGLYVEGFNWNGSISNWSCFTSFLTDYSFQTGPNSSTKLTPTLKSLFQIPKLELPLPQLWLAGKLWIFLQPCKCFLHVQCVGGLLYHHLVIDSLGLEINWLLYFLYQQSNVTLVGYTSGIVFVYERSHHFSVSILLYHMLDFLMCLMFFLPYIA